MWRSIRRGVLLVHAKKLQKKVEVKLQLFLTSALYGQIHTSAYLLPGKGAPVPFEQEDDGLQFQLDALDQKNMKINIFISFLYFISPEYQSAWTKGNSEIHSQRRLIFVFTTVFRLSCSPIGKAVSSSRVDWLGLEATLTTNTNFVPTLKQMEQYTSTPPSTFFVWCIFKHSDSSSNYKVVQIRPGLICV